VTEGNARNFKFEQKPVKRLKIQAEVNLDFKEKYPC
jgi:hypothetical protein